MGWQLNMPKEAEDYMAMRRHDLTLPAPDIWTIGAKASGRSTGSKSLIENA